MTLPSPSEAASPEAPRAATPQQDALAKRRTGGDLPEYLEVPEISGLLQSAPHAQARLLILLQWRAGLRVSEALQVQDLRLDDDNPVLQVRRGKGKKPRSVPVHPELRAALQSAMAYGRLVRRGPVIGRGERTRPWRGSADELHGPHRSTAWRWVQEALERAVQLGRIPGGRRVGTHTLRHSAARHWLASGIPINVVQRWLGHALLATTLIYLEILPDPLGDMNRVP